MLRSKNEVELIELLSVGDRTERDAVYFGIGYAIAINPKIKNVIDVKNTLYRINELTVIDLELLNDRTLKQVGLRERLCNPVLSDLIQGNSFGDSLGIGNFISPVNLQTIDVNYKLYARAVRSATQYVNSLLGD